MECDFIGRLINRVYWRDHGIQTLTRDVLEPNCLDIDQICNLPQCVGMVLYAIVQNLGGHVDAATEEKHSR